MNWQKTDTDERLIQGITILARVYWVGNMYAIDAFPPGKDQQTTTMVSLEKAKVWAEEQVK